MKTFLVLCLAVLTSCATTRSGEPVSRASMQAIVDEIASAHPDVARLSIHAPGRGGEMEIVASTVAGRVGERSDPEDLEAHRTGAPVEIKEAHNLDYTIPVEDGSGRILAVVGVTISGASGASDAELRERARAVADETAAAIRDGS